MRGLSKAVLLLLLALVLTAVGCYVDSDPVFPVTGKIVFEDGSPAKFGILEFRRSGDVPIVARGSIKSDGSFVVRTSGGRPGLRAGVHRAIIIQIVGGHRAGNVQHDHGKEVADKYKEYATSDLEIEVKPDGDRHFEIVVESK